MRTSLSKTENYIMQEWKMCQDLWLSDLLKVLSIPLDCCDSSQITTIFREYWKIWKLQSTWVMVARNIPQIFFLTSQFRNESSFDIPYSNFNFENSTLNSFLFNLIKICEKSCKLLDNLKFESRTWRLIKSNAEKITRICRFCKSCMSCKHSFCIL